MGPRIGRGIRTTVTGDGIRKIRRRSSEGSSRRPEGWDKQEDHQRGSKTYIGANDQANGQRLLHGRYRLARRARGGKHPGLVRGYADRSCFIS